jgi:hypothetical protein
MWNHAAFDAVVIQLMQQDVVIHSLIKWIQNMNVRKVLHLKGAIKIWGCHYFASWQG